MAAQGTVTVFNKAMEWIGTNEIDLDGASTFKVMLISSSVIPDPYEAVPDISLYDEVSGGNYSAGGYAIAGTFTGINTTTDIVTFDSVDNPLWTQSASGPTNIYYALIYDIADGQCLAFVVMASTVTTPEDTPVSMAAGDVNITWDAAGIFKLTRVV